MKEQKKTKQTKKQQQKNKKTGDDLHVMMNWANWTT